MLLKFNLLFYSLMFSSFACKNKANPIFGFDNAHIVSVKPSSIHFVNEIPLPAGYHLVYGNDSLFAKWLGHLPLRSDNTVYLYNHQPKKNQQAQYAVLDLAIGNKDLLQCADAVMKLRADYLCDRKRYNDISFSSTDGTILDYIDWLAGYRWKENGNKLIKYKYVNTANSQQAYTGFMETVFSYCNTWSLEKQLKLPPDYDKVVEPGDVFIKGGFPGHAELVIAVAENKNKDRIFLLAQGFMPAQDIHVLKNPARPSLSPWYYNNELDPLWTPEYVFKKGALRRW
jgi:hypothetical protein